MISYKLLLEMIHGPSKTWDENMEDHTKVKPGHHLSVLEKKLVDTYKHGNKSHYDPPNLKQQAIKSYTDVSVQLNAHLKKAWANKVKPSMNVDNLDHGLHNPVSLDEALKEHEAPTDFHVYSGLKGHPFLKTNYARPTYDLKHTKKVIKAVLPAYSSSSLDFNQAHSFASSPGWEHINPDKHILKIHIPKGSKHGAYVAHNSDQPHEREFLLRRGTKIHIHPEPETREMRVSASEPNHKVVDANKLDSKQLYNRAHKVHIWHATIVGNHYDEEGNK